MTHPLPDVQKTITPIFRTHPSEENVSPLNERNCGPKRQWARYRISHFSFYLFLLISILFIYSFIYLFIYLFTYLFIYFIYLSIYLSIYQNRGPKETSGWNYWKRS